MLIEQLNPSTGKTSMKALEFSSKWSERTSKYVTLAVGLTEDRYRRIISDTQALIVPGRSKDGSTAANSTQDSNDSFNIELDD
jgi:hypothetical protein